MKSKASITVDTTDQPVDQQVRPGTRVWDMSHGDALEERPYVPFETGLGEMEDRAQYGCNHDISRCGKTVDGYGERLDLRQLRKCLKVKPG